MNEFFRHLNVDQYEPMEPFGTWNPTRYHEEPGVSSSQLKVAEKNLALFERQYVTKEADPNYAQSESILVGNIVHAMLLEPQALEHMYVPEPDFSDREYLTATGKPAANPKLTNEYKKDVEEYQAKHNGAEIVKQDVWDKCLTMSGNVNRHEIAQQKLLWCDHFEQAFRFKDLERRMVWRVKFDAVSSSEGVIVDLKTTRDASPQEFTRSVHHFRYAGSIALYSLAYRVAFGHWPRESWLIAIANCDPYDVAVYDGLSVIEQGWQWVNKQMDRVANAKASKDWREEWHLTENEIRLDGWMLKQYA